MPSSPGTEPDQPPTEDPADSAVRTAELAQIEDRYRRALADLDNYRKRTAQEIDRRVQDAREATIRDWLDVVDSVERATRMELDTPCYPGLCAVLEQMDAVLMREGALRIGAPDEAFDPERHEAIAVAPSDTVPPHTVLAVQRSGFMIDGRVIRPAQVVVAGDPPR